MIVVAKIGGDRVRGGDRDGVGGMPRRSSRPARQVWRFGQNPKSLGVLAARDTGDGVGVTGGVVGNLCS